MKTIHIKKSNGKFRTIYVPSLAEKLELKSLNSIITKKAINFCIDYCHGFFPGRNPVTNALCHVGFDYTISMDLQDFFDSVKKEMIQKFLTKEEIEKCFVDGAPRQGLPTSPAIANLAATSIDFAITKLFKKKKLNVIYTRYADDLTFSFNEKENIKILLKEIPQIISRCGFTLNKKKTTIQNAKFGRRIITGIAVDHEKIYPTRKMKRKLRAARHQGKVKQIVGLKEWCACKKPKEKSDKEKEQNYRNVVEKLIDFWKLPKLCKKNKLPQKTEISLGNNCIITGDPAYILGMSTFTNGWTSCMRQPGGAYRKGVLTWLYLQGTRVACLLSDKTKTFGGIERRVMTARCLVHEMRNGKMFFDRLYGNFYEISLLKNILEKNGITNIREYHGEKLKVVGNTPNKYIPFCDNLKKTQATLKNSKKKIYIFHT